MKFALKIVWLCSILPVFAMAAPAASFYDFKVQNIDGKEVSLAAYRGQVLLVVNTASECGFTPQYKSLEQLYQKYKARGFTVLAFPANDFGGQEPGKEAEIKKFCELKYKTTFPLFSKVKVKKPGHPLYDWLQATAGETVGWNFGKFLIGRDGKVVRYFSSMTDPMADMVHRAVEKALAP